MSITTPIHTVPKELRGLWKLQYAPIEKMLEEALNDKNLTDVGKKNKEHYKKASIFQRLAILDRLHAEHHGVQLL